MKYYIAYGSNLNILDMNERCKDNKILGTGLLKDYKLVFMGGGHANVIKSSNSNVPVAVYKISDSDELELDYYEGVDSGYYIKKYIDIEVNNKIINALIYVMHPSIKNYESPSKNYLNTILQGCKDHNIPDTHIDECKIVLHYS